MRNSSSVGDEQLRRVLIAGEAARSFEQLSSILNELKAKLSAMTSSDASSVFTESTLASGKLLAAQVALVEEQLHRCSSHFACDSDESESSDGSDALGGR